MLLFLLIAILAFTTPVKANEPDLSLLRRLYLQAPADESRCRQLLQLVDGYTPNSAPLLTGYKAAATLNMAKHKLNPFSKLSHFNKGKKMLQKAVNAGPDQIELRFLRYGIQKSAPSFLCYHNERAADERFLKRRLSAVHDASLKDIIVKLLNQPWIFLRQ